MISSMTGFGRYETVTEDYKITVEIKSVNHRYLDFSVKLPKKFNTLEASIRNLVKQDVKRGKVDMYLTFEDSSEEKVSLKYNAGIAREYLRILNQMDKELHQDAKNSMHWYDVTVSSLARMPEVITMESAEEEERDWWPIIKETIENAVCNFNKARCSEGERLKQDLLKKLDHMLELVALVEKRSPQIVQMYRQELEEKVKNLLSESGLDESRIAAEVTLYADKTCIDEEIVRLRSHIVHTKEELEKGGGIGRKLDFIAQEMNREANTILSKANDLELSDTGIDLKTEIEKVREQIQNIE